ncbi:sugar ABC transporter substrate-binding protein [Christensenella tenuis]|uniref:Substrate-binding domain-containing protein n=1 Tax=Christensenella tenuis TaxID=2763033 RepID=A0ABR7EH72_9FIRM|nr:substrate-binding domain-containing protein [Christensenella tenuis]MBC5649102.1 substrate-binding domain-containing protein [Christensenella tenuis]
MKKKIALILTAVMLLSMVLAACGSPVSGETTTAETAQAQESPAEGSAGTTAAADGEDGLVITFVSPLLGMEVWLNAKYGAEAAAEEIGAQVTWVGPSSIDMDEQVRQIELAIAENVDGIISCPLSPVIFEDVYKRALDKNIKIVNTAVDSAEDTRTAYIGTDYTNFGEQAAKNLSEKLGGKGNVAVLVTSLDSENQMSEMKAGQAWLEQNAPDVKIVVTEVTNSDTAQAADKTSAIIDTYPDLDAIWCLEAASPLGSSQAVAERGLTDEIVILGIDDTTDVLDLIDQGAIWGTMTQDFYKMGYEAVKMIAAAHNGESVPSVQDSGTTLVTKENLEEYKNRF